VTRGEKPEAQGNPARVRRPETDQRKRISASEKKRIGMVKNVVPIILIRNPVQEKKPKGTALEAGNRQIETYEGGRLKLKFLQGIERKKKLAHGIRLKILGEARNNSAKQLKHLENPYT